MPTLDAIAPPSALLDARDPAPLSGPRYVTAAARDLGSATGTHVDPEDVARRIAKPHLAGALADAVRAQLDPSAMLAAERRRILAGR